MNAALPSACTGRPDHCGPLLRPVAMHRRCLQSMILLSLVTRTRITLSTLTSRKIDAMLAPLLLIASLIASLRATDIRRNLFDYKAGHRSLPDLPRDRECARWTVKLETCARETPKRSPNLDFWADEARCMLLEEMGDDCVSITETYEFGPNDHDHIMCTPPLKAFWATAVIWRSPKQHNLDLENTTLTSPYLNDIHSIRTRAVDFQIQEQGLKCRGKVPAAECACVSTCQWETVNGTTLVSDPVKKQKPSFQGEALSSGFDG